MAYFRYECFCTLTYDHELTYEEVLDREMELQAGMKAILEEREARHIDFIPINDSLQIHGAFVEWDTGDFPLLCAQVADLTVAGVNGRLLVVNKDLVDIFFGHMTGGHCVMGRLPLDCMKTTDVPAKTSRNKTGERKGKKTDNHTAFAVEPVLPLSAEEREVAQRKFFQAPPDPTPANTTTPPATMPLPQLLADLLPDTDKSDVSDLPDALTLLAAWREQMRRQKS